MQPRHLVNLQPRPARVTEKLKTALPLPREPVRMLLQATRKSHNLSNRLAALD